MIAANAPRGRGEAPRLLVVNADGVIRHATRDALVELAHPGDVVVANDAFTAPASLRAVHERSATSFELRLAGLRSHDLRDLTRCIAVTFGAGDHRMRTEDRGPPPTFASGDRIRVGPLRATIEGVLDHPRLIDIAFEATASEVWALLAAHGRPIQYAHVAAPLALWDIWTSVAAAPVAFEAPSAGFVLDWRLLARWRERGVRFVTLTHAAGLSSTGDPQLDRRLPFDEPYAIPVPTFRAIERARDRGGRVIAIGTTVVRALEHAARDSGRLSAGPGIATQRIDATTRLAVVDAIVSGTHEPGTSHYELLRAFASEAVLLAMSEALERCDYRTHEFGDFIVLQAAARPPRSHSIPTPAPRSAARARCHAPPLPA